MFPSHSKANKIKSSKERAWGYNGCTDYHCAQTMMEDWVSALPS